MSLADQKCEPCRAGTPPLSREEIEALLEETPGWTLKEHSIEREYRFKDFRQAIDFVNEIAKAAEEEGHHPDLFISYNKVRVELWTHKIGGLSNNDFILAARIDRLPVPVG